jgi:hypothetical protein
VIVPVTLPTISAALTKVRADLTARGIAATVLLGKRHLKDKHDPTTGVVVVVPEEEDGAMGGPRLLGGNPRPLFTLAQPLALHFLASAGTQSDPLTQYEADLTQTELLRANVLRSFEILIPGAKRGGRSRVVDVGNIVFGAYIVTKITIDLEQADTTYELATGAVFAPSILMEFPDGHTESGSDP